MGNLLGDMKINILYFFYMQLDTLQKRKTQEEEHDTN